MTERDVLLRSLDAAQRELDEALLDLPDADVWRRADPRLLSVGELLAHVAYWEARSFFGDAFASPLFADSARYYTASIETPRSLPLHAEAVAAEVRRVHEAGMAEVRALAPDLDAPNRYRPGCTWRDTLEYQAFHVAYHTGQIYSVRHLFGHATSDN